MYESGKLNLITDGGSVFLKRHYHRPLVMPTIILLA